MQYIYLAIAIGTEIFAVTLLKMSQGFSRLLPSIGCCVAYIVCYLCFARALKSINLGVAYATWCGIGIIATSVISWLVFNQKLNGIGILSIILIAAGCVMLNLFGTAIE